MDSTLTKKQLHALAQRKYYIKNKEKLNKKRLEYYNKQSVIKSSSSQALQSTIGSLSIS